MYNVTFAETGLPSGTGWSVSLGGSSMSSTGSTMVFTRANGSYPFSVTAVGYAATPSAGTIAVSGAATGQSIVFVKATTYTVTFRETGLSPGASWSVTFHSATQSSTTTTNVFPGVTNGTYAFSASASGYTANPASGSIVVAGSDPTQAVAFTGSSSSSVPYSQAETTADSIASQHGATSRAILAVAINTASSFSNATGFPSECSWSGPSSITFPAASSSYYSGLSSGWYFYFYVASPVSLVVVSVDSGSGSYVGTLSGSGCTFLQYFADVSTPSTVIDSTAATQAVSSNASSFILAHPVANSTVALIGTTSIFGYTVWATWNITYSTCDFHATAGTGDFFVGEVNATSGQVIYSSTYTQSCSSAYPAAASPAPPGFLALSSHGAPRLGTSSPGAGYAISTPELARLV